jgi:hypothetical protein
MKLNKEDLNKCIMKMPPIVSELVKSGFYIGGGFIRSVLNKEEISDFDIFANSLAQVEREVGLFDFGKPGGKHLLSNMTSIFKGSTSNAYTIKISGQKPIQFITKWLFLTPEDCMKSFDYAICRAIIFWNKDAQEFDSVVDPDFYYSLNHKKLIYCNPIREEVAAGSFLRMQKFILKGYKIDQENLAKVTARMLMGMSKCNFSLAKTEAEFESNVMEMFEDATANFR